MIEILASNRHLNEDHFRNKILTDTNILMIFNFHDSQYGSHFHDLGYFDNMSKAENNVKISMF